MVPVAGRARAQRTQSPGLIALAEEARSAGVPHDQLKRLLAAGWVPQPKQLEFHAAARACDLAAGPTKVGFGGARGPGKSSTIIAQVGGDDCQRRDGLNWLLLRKIGKAGKQAFEQILIKRFPAWLKYWIPSQGMLRFPNRSQIIVGHFSTESDVDAYVGLEYDGIVIEEATQLSKSKTDGLLGSLRTSRSDWRPRAYFTWNPGGVGHQHIKSLFVTPYRQKRETDTRFIPATVHDNVFVNAEYLAFLHSLTGWLRKAWLDGDHDIAAGQFFTTWRQDVHVGETPPIGKEWDCWCSLDYGFTHPTVVYLITEREGKRYVIDEYAEVKRLPGQNAAGIIEMLG